MGGTERTLGGDTKKGATKTAISASLDTEQASGLKQNPVNILSITASTHE